MVNKTLKPGIILIHLLSHTQIRETIMILLKDMISISPKIKQDVLSLPARERIDLVDRFITSLNVPTDPDVDSHWGDIAVTRPL